MLEIYSWAPLKPKIKITALTSDLNHNFKQTMYKPLFLSLNYWELALVINNKQIVFVI